MISIPVTDLKNTSNVATICQEASEPVLVTKNGRPAFWLVKPEDMERLNACSEREQLRQAVDHSERQWREGAATDAMAGIAAMRDRYGL